MNQASNNPATNQLGAGVSESQVLDAVEKSGYPLQTHVGDVLRSAEFGGQGKKFHVQEEWSFVDRDTKELRNMDLHAELRLHSWDPQTRVRPSLNLLIECKQSELPYVFFLGWGKLRLLSFPAVAGLRQDKVIITSDDDPSRWTFSVVHALDLDRDPFQNEPPFCYTLSKCARKGRNLELSGSSAYSNLVLPLIKSLQHFSLVRAPVETAWYFDSHLTMALGILDAPMIGVSIDQSVPVLTALPWVRVLRHEYLEGAERFERDQLWVLDIVHKDFFLNYLETHLVPFAERFAERVLRHPTELATGHAFIPGMGANSWDRLETRMQPQSVSARAARSTALGKNIVRGLFQRSARG